MMEKYFKYMVKFKNSKLARQIFTQKKIAYINKISSGCEGE